MASQHRPNMPQRGRRGGDRDSGGRARGGDRIGGRGYGGYNRGGYSGSGRGRGRGDGGYGRDRNGGRGNGGGDHSGGRGRGYYDPAPSSFPDLHQASVPKSVPVVGTTCDGDDGEITNGIANLGINVQEGSSSESVGQSSELVNFPTRPVDAGRSGRRCLVKANHFQLKLKSSVQFYYHYNVVIEPETKMETENRELMKILFESYKNSCLGNLLLAYDGQKSLYTARPLPLSSNSKKPSSETKEFKVTLTTKSGFMREFNVAINLVAVLDMQNMSAPEVLQALDVVLRQTAISKYLPVRRSFYGSSFGACDIGGGLEARSGFYQSVRPTQMGFSLNFDISSTVFVANLEVVEFVQLILHSGTNPANKPLSDPERVKVKRALKGLKVEATHGKVRRKYTVSGLTLEPTEQLTFVSGDDGTTKYVVQYFREKYGVQLKYTSWPCLQVGNKGKPNYLPMEVCKIVDGQRYTKALNGSQKKKLVNFNSQRPAEREAIIKQMFRQNDYQNDEYAKEFGIMIIGDPTRVQARVLPAPQLKYLDDAYQPKEGQWNMKGKKVCKRGLVNSWACINFAVDVRDERARSFCYELATMCNTQGVMFNTEPVLPPYRAYPGQVERELRTLMAKMARDKSDVKELNLLIVILPTDNGPLYGEVKRICETKLGLVSVCFLAEMVIKTIKNKMLVANVPSKINAKVGGTNTVIDGGLPKVSDKPTIIFGADVTHPSPGEGGIPSIAAVVASMDSYATKYFPEFSAQEGHQEMIQDLDRMVRAHFHSFFEIVKRKPERIIFYRDGVSEGQFEHVRKYELKAIEKAWNEEFNGTAFPPITFLVVQKRHHTKLFPADYNDPTLSDRSGNIVPGTLVDSQICHPTQFDFYLCSHAGIKGTSRPAHYHVLWDDNNFTADEIQTLSYRLCYIYARCTRSVSYPAPTYYAHRLAAHARLYLGDDPLSDENSVAMGKSAQSAGALVKKLPLLCDKLKHCPIYL